MWKVPEEAECARCPERFLKWSTNRKYCSPRCAAEAQKEAVKRYWERHPGKRQTYGRARSKVPPPPKPCKGCGVKFEKKRKCVRQDYCSAECRDKARRERSRREVAKWRAQWPGLPPEPRKPRGRDPYGILYTAQFFREHQEVEKKCQARGCAEDRVLDIAHRPEFARKGMPMTRANTKPWMVWVLCPTHHALLDRKVCTAGELGLRDLEEPGSGKAARGGRRQVNGQGRLL